MTLDQYSVLLTIGVLAIGVVTILGALGYVFSVRIREKLLAFEYFNYVKAISVIAIIATLGALTYQFYYETPVCELCWWQRIFLFPIDVIALVSLFYMVRVNHIIIGILGGIGALFASYHYYYHFQIFVLGKTLSLPCDGYGLLPACTSSPILIFGFVTIPLMGLIVFLSILLLSFLAHRVHQKKVHNITESTHNQSTTMEQHTTPEVSTPVQTEVKAQSKGFVVKPWMGVAIALVLIFGALIFSFKGLFIAATVDGSPISRLAIIESLEKQGGAQALDALITEKLIAQAVREKGVAVSIEDIDAEIKKIEEQVATQGGTLADALLQQGMTEEDLRARITEQKKIEMILADKVSVTDEEVVAYITDNKITVPKGADESEFKSQVKEQLEQQKFGEVAQTWLTGLKADADINLYVTY